METASPPTPPERAPQDGDDAPAPRVIGLVADPGTPWALVRRIAGDVEDRLDERLPQPGGWRVETRQESLPVGATGGMVLEEPVRSLADGQRSVSYTHLTLPTTLHECRSRWSPSH